MDGNHFPAEGAAIIGRTACPRDPPGKRANATASEDKIRIVLEGLARRVFHRRAVYRREGHCPEPLLQVVEGVPGSWQEAPIG